MQVSLSSTVLLTALLTFDSAAAAAQARTDEKERPGRWQLGAGAVVDAPVGDFSTYVGTSPGFYVQVDRRFANGPFILGGDFAWVKYGGTHRSISLAELVPEIPGAQLKVETTNQMYLGHARVRAQRQRGRWRPYADGLVGLNALVTDSSIPGVVDCVLNQGTSVCVNTTAAGATNASSFVASYGGGAGLQFKYWSIPIWLDVSGRYLRGGRTRYLTEGDLRAESGRVVLTFRESRTDMAMLYVGMALGR
jgi:hypothetical protein